METERRRRASRLERADWRFQLPSIAMSTATGLKDWMARMIKLMITHARVLVLMLDMDHARLSISNCGEARELLIMIMIRCWPWGIVR